jgi:uncharacterized protein YndB with AHSA1/START domain
METEPYDWSQFSVRININAPLENLYKAWATREGIEYWFLRLSEYKKPDGALRDTNELVKKGDTYKWLWHGYPDDTVEHGEILKANGKDIFSFRFGKAGNCRVKIFEEQGEQIVELVQDNIPTDEHGKQYFHVGCKTGWTFHFTNFKSLFEGGIDLRNKNANLKNVINS